MRLILSIAVISSLLLSTMQLQVGAHFCGGELKSVAIYGNAEPCSHASHENENKPQCHSSRDNDEDTKGCCDDIEYTVDALDISVTIDQYWNGVFSFINGIVPESVEVSKLISVGIDNRQSFHKYKPPLLRRDISILIQTFLI